MSKCPNCGGTVGVTTKRLVGSSVVRYIGCKKFCGCKEVRRKLTTLAKNEFPRFVLP
jgi:hypothetical protein